MNGGFGHELYWLARIDQLSLEELRPTVNRSLRASRQNERKLYSNCKYENILLFFSKITQIKKDLNEHVLFTWFSN